MAKSTSAANGTAPSSLTFPPSIFAALSPAAYLHAHLSSPSSLRANGRSPSTFRTPVININSLTHCNGSAVVRLGSTSVVAGVRGEILLAKDVPNPPTPAQRSGDPSGTMERLGLLVPNLELNTGCTPNFIPGSAPSAAAQVLTSRIHQLLCSTDVVNLEDLEIRYTRPKIDEEDEPEEEVIAYWTLYIDIVYISLDGGAFDAAWGAVMAALRSTILPKAWWDGDLETVVCSDRVEEAHRLRVGGLPIALSFAVFEGQGMGKEDEVGRWVLADPDSFEEGLCDEVVAVTVDGSGGKTKVVRIEKSGGGVVGRGEMKTLVDVASKSWEIWAKACG